MAVHESELKLLANQGDVYYHDCPETTSTVIEVVGDFDGKLVIEGHPLLSSRSKDLSTWSARELYIPLLGMTGLNTILNNGSDLVSSYYLQPMGQSIRVTLSELNSGSVYIRITSSHDNGFFLTKSYKNRVVVKSASDLSGTLDSTKTYFIDGDVDMGSTQIYVPEGGLYIISDDPDIKGLYSTAENYTMFIKDPAASYAGGVRMRLMHLQCSGSNSKLFDLDNDSNNGSFEFTTVNFGGFSPSTGVTNIGDVSNYRQLFFDGCGFYNVIDGFTLNGTFSGAVFQTSNAINTVNDLNTLVEEGVSLIIQGSYRVTSFNFNSVNSDAIFTDISETNLQTKGGFSLGDFRTTADDATPNIKGFSTYARFRNNNGVKNTYVGGQYTITSAVTTNITASNSPFKMAGTTASTDLQWFTDDGGANNRLLYDGEQTIEVECKGVVSISGGNNNQVAAYFRQWDDSASTFIDGSFATATLNGGLLGTRAEGIPFFGYFTLDNGDYIEVWVQNLSGTTNVVAEVGGLFSVTERPS